MLQNFAQKIMDDEDLITEFGGNLAQEVADNIIIASIVEREIASPATREEDEAEKVA
jgi:cell division protein YceG involved in septum cleavage